MGILSVKQPLNRMYNKYIMGRKNTDSVRPNAWKHSDPIKHKKYMPFLRHRSQCWYRNEEFDMTFEEWMSIWTEEAWGLRGRERNSLCMTRKDNDLGWTVSNCELVTRLEMLRRNANWKNRKY